MRNVSASGYGGSCRPLLSNPLFQPHSRAPPNLSGRDLPQISHSSIMVSSDGPALCSIPKQLIQGFMLICIKPDDRDSIWLESCLGSSAQTRAPGKPLTCGERVGHSPTSTRFAARDGIGSQKSACQRTHNKYARSRRVEQPTSQRPAPESIPSLSLTMSRPVT